MKKLTASIFTVLLATVGAANAEIASRAYVDQQDDAIDAKITTLNGAANVAGSVANKIAAAIDQEYNATSTNAQSGTAVAEAIAGVASTAGSALQSVTANDGAGVVTNIATNGTAVTMTKAKVTGSDIADNANIARTQLATDVQTSLGKADTAQQPATTLAGYGIDNAYTKTETDAAITAATTTAGMLTTSNYATTLDPVYINASEVTSTYAADGTAPVTGAAVNAAITGLNLADTYQAKGNYATAEQGAKADTALQKADIESGTANGTIAVDGTDVAVTGLGGAAYQNVATTVSSDNTTAPVSGSAVAAAISDAGGQTAEQVQTAINTKVGTLDGVVNGTGNVVTAVTEADGVVTTTMGNAILQTDTINENGTYVLTTTRTGSEGNYTYTYQWENITRATGN